MRALTEYPDPPGFCVEQICAAVEKVLGGKESPQSGHYHFPPIRRDGHLSHISIHRSFSCVVHRHISAAEAQTVWGLYWVVYKKCWGMEIYLVGATDASDGVYFFRSGPAGGLWRCGGASVVRFWRGDGKGKTKR